LPARKRIGIGSFEAYGRAAHTGLFRCSVVRQQEAGWEEWKTEEDLDRLNVHNPNRYSVGKDGQWHCPPGKAYAEPLRLYYRLRCASEINWTYQRNIQFLEDYFRSDVAVFPSKQVLRPGVPTVHSRASSCPRTNEIDPAVHEQLITAGENDLHVANHRAVFIRRYLQENILPASSEVPVRAFPSTDGETPYKPTCAWVKGLADKLLDRKARFSGSNSEAT
jgi:hypothetical protein